jgi:cyclophilin family peptidyl-prolyl cis-trans isomerase
MRLRLHSITAAGDLTCLLFPEKAPIGVKNFVGLATGTKDWRDPRTGQIVHGRPLYDGTVCHRIVPEFMIQCGDPLGTGSGGWTSGVSLKASSSTSSLRHTTSSAR